MVVVAVGFLESAAMVVVNGRFAIGASQGKMAFGSDGDTSCAFWGADDITGLESANGFCSWKIEARKSEFVGFGALVGATACGRDKQRAHCGAFGAEVHLSGKGGVERMGFGNLELGAVEFGFCACGGFEWQAGGGSHGVYSVPEDVHGGTTAQWFLELCLECFYFDGAAQENFEGLVVFGLVTGQAGQGEVGNPVTATGCLRDDMVTGEGNVGFATVSAAVVKFCQKVFPDGETVERSFLVFGPRNFRVLKFLGIEFGCFDNQTGNWNPLAKPSDPTGKIV